MAGMKKQLLKWREEWLRYWDKTSLVMRIVIGAVVSLSLASGWLNWQNKPLAEEVKNLQNKLGGIVADNSFNLQMASLRQQRNKLEEEVETWRRKMAEIARQGLHFESANCGVVLLELRRRLEDRNLVLRREKLEPPPVPTPVVRRRVRIVIPSGDDWKTRHTYPAFMGTIRYNYLMTGGFREIKSFLFSLPEIRRAFNLNNIVIDNIEPEHPDSLALEFDLSVPTMSRSGSNASTAGSTPRAEQI